MNKKLKKVLFVASIVLLIVFAPFYSLAFIGIWFPVVETIVKESSPEIITEYSLCHVHC